MTGLSSVVANERYKLNEHTESMYSISYLAEVVNSRRLDQSERFFHQEYSAVSLRRTQKLIATKIQRFFVQSDLIKYFFIIYNGRRSI